MRVTLGQRLDGGALTLHERARWGAPVWGPHAMLRDLELRLGLCPPRTERGPRIASWVERIETLRDEAAFYWRSFVVDRTGTAEALLAWRDDLVEGGWSGEPVDGSPRLAALAKLEAAPSLRVVAGHADRLAAVEVQLRSERERLYERVEVVEAPALWTRRWQAIFDHLQRTGTVFARVAVEAVDAPEGTDLATLKRAFRATKAVERSDVQGDGSVVLLHGETTSALAEMVAAQLEDVSQDVVVVRLSDLVQLDTALEVRGLATQGASAPSRWRPSAQVLSLALELAFEPKDPHRVLELLTLPVGPFRGGLGARLARAVARQPGIGGKEWRRERERAEAWVFERALARASETGDEEAARAKARAVTDERMGRVAVWLEAAGATDGAIEREKLMEVVGRVRDWLQSRIAAEAGGADALSISYAQARELHATLATHPADRFSQREVRVLHDSVVRATEVETRLEEAGRTPHVRHPAELLAPAGTVIVWGFTANTERRPRPRPWSKAEVEALARQGVTFPSIADELAAEVESWRRTVLLARRRVVFVRPRTILGEATASHPLWDEILARLGIAGDRDAIARLTVDVGNVLAGAATPLAAHIEDVAPRSLPESRASWSLPAALLDVDGEGGRSVTALQALVGCPLAWVLEHRAKLRFGAIAKVASGPLLYGNLGHRLVEELFVEGAFDADESAFRAHVESILDVLVQTEAGTLLLDGAAFELTQLRTQLLRAARELHRYLKQANLRVAAVEEPIPLHSIVGSPNGRLDVRLETDDGSPAVLDLKWGTSTYRSLLEQGQALQLAAYAMSLRPSSQAPVPPAGYYSISAAAVLTADPRMKASKTLTGPTLDATWRSVERTRSQVLQVLQQGVVPVANTRAAPPLLEQLGIPEDQRDGHYTADADAACEYCAFATLCGRAWEKLQ